MSSDKLEITKEKFNEILSEIEDADSPVGIDAAKTHIIILNKLLEIESRLSRIEETLHSK